MVVVVVVVVVVDVTVVVVCVAVVVVVNMVVVVVCVEAVNSEVIPRQTNMSRVSSVRPFSVVVVAAHPYICSCLQCMIYVLVLLFNV